MQNSISNLSMIQNAIEVNVGTMKPQSSYTMEVTLNTSKLGEILILGNSFLTKFENGSLTLACIEVNCSNNEPEKLTLSIRPDSNQLIHPDEGVNIVFRRLVSSPRGNGVCWESRPAYLEDIEEMDSNSILAEDAKDLYELAFGL